MARLGAACSKAEIDANAFNVRGDQLDNEVRQQHHTIEGLTKQIVEKT